MDISVYSDAYLSIGTYASKIEDAGFTKLWIYDSPLLFGEPYLAMLQALSATSRIVIGPGVTHPGSRPGVATAQALATLAKAAPGRVVFGVGTGASARRSLGLSPATLDELSEYVRTVQSLLGGDECLSEAGEGNSLMRFIHPEGRWINIANPIETWVSAFGPRGQRRAATMADGILVRWEGAQRLAEVRDRVDQAAVAAGRHPADIAVGVVYAVYPVDTVDELDGAEARQALGPLVVSRLRYLTSTYQDPSEVPAQFRAGFRAYQRYRDSLNPRTGHLDNYRGYLSHTPPELEPFINAESMATVCLVGSTDEVTGELQRMSDAGVTQVSLQIAGTPTTWIGRMGTIISYQTHEVRS